VARARRNGHSGLQNRQSGGEIAFSFHGCGLVLDVLFMVCLQARPARVFSRVAASEPHAWHVSGESPARLALCTKCGCLGIMIAAFVGVSRMLLSELVHKTTMAPTFLRRFFALFFSSRQTKEGVSSFFDLFLCFFFENSRKLRVSFFFSFFSSFCSLFFLCSPFSKRVLWVPFSFGF
jgi:hypothetical protein